MIASLYVQKSFRKRQCMSAVPLQVGSTLRMDRGSEISLKALFVTH